MKVTRVGHKYAVITDGGGKYLAVEVLSEHDDIDGAIKSVLEVMKKESENVMKEEIERLREQGIRAVSFEEAIKDMTPGQRQRLIDERNVKFVDPLLNSSIEMLERKKRRLSIRRIK